MCFILPNVLEDVNIAYGRILEKGALYLNPMLNDPKNKSGGRINYTLLAGGILGPGPEHYDIVALGHSDMEAKGLPAREAVIAFNEECRERVAECVAFPPGWR
ncbi:Uncharacterised protein [uncultured archaeon]|nr:Uncharacterised protein [uncultured archaeon]